MSSQFWKHPRSNIALMQQWSRRVNTSLPFILKEVDQRMLTRAQVMRPVQGGVVHHGWLHPQVLQGVKTLFANRHVAVFSPLSIEWPQAPVNPPDSFCLTKLWRGWLNKSTSSQSIAVPIGARLPVDDSSQSMVWSTLWLHALEAPDQQLADWLRVLKPEGGIFWSCFGPDTAQEIKGLCQALGEPFPDFADMHDMGDLMSRQGFSDPVMEMEKLTLTYATPEALLADWRALMGNSLKQRQQGLCTLARYTRALVHLENLRSAETGRIPLTLELIYGHAWKVKKQVRPDIATVKVTDIKGRKSLN